MAFIADAALGSGISELLKVVIAVAKQTLAFKTNLQSVERTLKSVKPVFDEIKKLHKVLDRPQEETDQFIEHLHRGVQLVKKCTTIPCWNKYKHYIYSNKLVDLDKSIAKFFQIEVQGLAAVNSMRAVVGVKESNDKLDLILKSLNISDSGFSFWGSVPGVRDEVVGFKQPLKDLKQMLLKDTEIVKVVSAPGGCGKTTLAKMLCHDPDIRSKASFLRTVLNHFFLLILCLVSVLINAKLGCHDRSVFNFGKSCDSYFCGELILMFSRS